ncbi:FkbM family methyltransferase [Mesorhizobium sp. PL10]
MLKDIARRLVRGLGYDVIRYETYDERSVTPGKLVSWKLKGITVNFFILDEGDLIQREHLHQRFYEPDELGIIGNYFNGGVFLDVGANVGNHTLYAALFLGASKVVAVEPNPAAQRILRLNIALNGLGDKVMNYPVGLSDALGSASISASTLAAVANLHNLGQMQLDANSGGTIDLITGDDLMRGLNVDFIKIDTEGMEIKVLKGLSRTIDKDRPGLFVEVDERNEIEFAAFAEQHGYAVRQRYRRYPTTENILAMPR